MMMAPVPSTPMASPSRTLEADPPATPAWLRPPCATPSPLSCHRARDEHSVALGGTQPLPVEKKDNSNEIDDDEIDSSRPLHERRLTAAERGMIAQCKLHLSWPHPSFLCSKALLAGHTHHIPPHARPPHSPAQLPPLVATVVAFGNLARRRAPTSRGIPRPLTRVAGVDRQPRTWRSHLKYAGLLAPRNA